MALALAVTVLAGLSTCVGGWLGTRRVALRPGVMAAALCFAAGVMITISVLEIAPSAQRALSEVVGGRAALLWVLGAMVVGGAVVHLFCHLMPHRFTPAEAGGGEDLRRIRSGELDVGLLRTGLLLAGVVGLHNLPEGLATLVATLDDPRVGVVLAAAIAIHNIPEGLVVAAPIYAATGSRRRAMLWAAASGLAEPVGAVLGYLALRALLPVEWVDLSLALVAGMMIAVSLVELIPTALRYAARRRDLVAGFSLGAVVMGLSLALLTL
ncbi:Metal transporter, ZIP family [Serinicoccus hydrothermalis]|uniref:Metal transporter, ZIP family n=1 Tax=Serinicoccus hydrothermalis TaxID=1758689 RepID=A0A1B1NBY5_9MICO|nr:ZIP family metal transporter [Serinicoccus hydrothermalis]ANS78960.1 Metal transporter, ZIP family [Serinicoccus hydrothermalis]